MANRTEPGQPNIHELLKKLNELWIKRMDDNGQLDENKEETEQLIAEIIVRGYTIISEIDFIKKIAAQPGPASPELVAFLKIHEEKNTAAQSQQYEDAARLRDKEKLIMAEVLSSYFNTDVNTSFLLSEGLEKIVMYRKTGFLKLDELALNFNIK